MKNHRVWCILLAALVATSASAGDLADFANLGFSANSEYFMFSQYGVDAVSRKPYAEIFTVHVPTNRFAPDGVRRSSYGTLLEPGQDPAGALYTALGEASRLVAQYRINHLAQGRILYFRINSDDNESLLEFRDFNSGATYIVQLNQNATGSKEAARAAFHLRLTITDLGGRVRNFTVGNPGLQRELVTGYRIQQIILGPDERSLVFVVEMDRYTPGGKAVRYMVETVRVN